MCLLFASVIICCVTNYPQMRIVLAIKTIADYLAGSSVDQPSGLGLAWLGGSASLTGLPPHPWPADGQLCSLSRDLAEAGLTGLSST